MPTIVTQEWLNYLHSKIAYPKTPADVFKIAIHIRREHISPCNGDKMHRYPPNQYYLDMIDKYTVLALQPEHVHKVVEVVIHLQTTTAEPMDVFQQRNYTIKREETPLQDVWKELMTADVFIMSQTGFSLVPALLKPRGRVVFPTFSFLKEHRAGMWWIGTLWHTTKSKSGHCPISASRRRDSGWAGVERGSFTRTLERTKPPSLPFQSEPRIRRQHVVSEEFSCSMRTILILLMY
jgi:hypothetical protein